MDDTTFDPRVPFRSRAGVKAGITRKRLRGPGFVQVFHDTYVAASVELTPRLLAHAALVRAGPNARISHFTLAHLADLPVPKREDTWVTVEAEAQRIRVPGIECAVGRGERRQSGALMTSTPADLFVELAPLIALIDRVVLGDALVKSGKVTLAELNGVVMRSTKRGARHAREAIGLVREKVDSPMETRLRLLLVFAGLPEPGINVTVTDGAGRRRRFDLLYQECRVAIEYDGKGHRRDDEKWEADLIRREDVGRVGFLVVTVLANGIFNRPDQTLARVVAALVEQGAQLPPLRDDWRRHFKVIEQG